MFVACYEAIRLVLDFGQIKYVCYHTLTVQNKALQIIRVNVFKKFH